MEVEAGSRIESPAFRRHKAAVSRLLTERGPDRENRELNGANNTMSCWIMLLSFLHCATLETAPPIRFAYVLHRVDRVASFCIHVSLCIFFGHHHPETATAFAVSRASWKRFRSSAARWWRSDLRSSSQASVILEDGKVTFDWQEVKWTTPTVSPATTKSNCYLGTEGKTYHLIAGADYENNGRGTKQTGT